jgi:hypothetical protein
MSRKTRDEQQRCLRIDVYVRAAELRQITRAAEPLSRSTWARLQLLRAARDAERGALVAVK